MPKQISLSKFMTRIVLPLVVLFAFGCAGTRNTGGIKVTGLVRYPDGTAVPNADVSTNPFSLVVRTDQAGRFRISQGLTQGEYEFIAEFQGQRGVTAFILAPGSRGGEIVITIGEPRHYIGLLMSEDDRLPSDSSPGHIRPGNN